MFGYVRPVRVPAFARGRGRPMTVFTAACVMRWPAGTDRPGPFYCSYDLSLSGAAAGRRVGWGGAGGAAEAVPGPSAAGPAGADAAAGGALQYAADASVLLTDHQARGSCAG